MSAGKPFEPEITAFYCIYCGYMAADTAGALGIQYPANMKFLRLPCTGKTDVRYLIEAFEQGADGVYLVACPIGNCHHVRGNERGRARVARAKQILDEIGLGGERLDMFFMSGSQAHAFAEAARTMTERIRELGPNPLKRAESVPAQADDTDTDDEISFRGRRPDSPSSTE
jgi:F420-non-reducing hydrogenase iron-sulfur subunit